MPFPYNIITLLLLVAIVISLFTGLIFMIKDKGKSRRTLNALILRIVLTVCLFALLIVGIMSGVIQPHGVNG